MKKIKYIIAFLSLAFVFNACEEENYEFGDIIAPSNVEITYEIVGKDAANPDGDGSGTIIFNVTADNAITYKFVKDGTVSISPLGSKSYNFVSTTGPVGTFDVVTVTVSAVALGTGGVSTSTSVSIDVLAPNVPPPVIIEDFEGDQLPIENFGSEGYAVYKSNPDKSGINESETVIEHMKASGSETWAGFVFASELIDMTVYKKTALKIWSPTAGTPIQFKLETIAGNSGPIHEIIVPTTLSNTWEEFVFDFSEIADEDWVRIVIFCDWNTSGNDDVYYIDDIKLLN